jgi:putative ABC transport system substrate-binding protein
MRLLRMVAAAAALISLAAAAQAVDKHVAITQIVEHPALDACRNGVKDELAAAGFVEGKGLKWTYESAQGNAAVAAQIAKKFAGDEPDVIVAIATPSAQTMAASAKRTPIVFSAVTDPVGAKLVEAWNKPGEFITGVSDKTPIDKHLALVKRLAPKTRTVGVIYNPGEANAVSILNSVKEEAPKLGLTVVEASAPRSGDVLAAARSLVGKVDAIYIGTDNTVVSAFEAVVKVGTESKIPVFAGDTASVERGAVAALGFDYYDIGRQTGKVVARILNGEKPGTIAVSGVEKMDLYLNLKTAPQMGLEIPQNVIAEAQKVIR